MSVLDQILESTRARIAESKQKLSEPLLEERVAGAPAPRGFEEALAGDETSIIAEIKRASPAKGDLDPGLNAADMARTYQAGGAAAISVLTEPEYFKGSLEDLEAVRRAVELPVLRKDFIVDEFQLLEARAAGADAVLLIVRALKRELDHMLRATRALSLDALVEVYDEDDVEIAVDAGASLVGVNNRDLETFEVDPDRTAKLAKLLPEDVIVAGLSGVSTRSEVEALARSGARAVLVGESLVMSPDPAALLRELTGATGG
jgi:indole-3-glycerol phosphate synthase